MSSLATVAMVAASVLLLIAVMVVVKWAARRLNWSAELQRKAVHIAAGLYALTLPLTFSTPGPVVALSAAAVAVMLVLRTPRFAKAGIGSTLHSVERRSVGDILLAVSIGLVFYRSIGDSVLYVLPMAILTLADAAAALAGTTYGRRVYAVADGTKSLEGVAVFFLVAWILSVIVLLLMTDIDRPNVILISTLIAGFGALVEADSWGGFDNLFIPVAIHLFLESHLRDTPLQLLLLSLEFVAVLVALRLAASRLKLTTHAARAFAILVFIVLAIVEPVNAVVVLLALAAHLAAQRTRPSTATYPDLEIVTALACVGVIWLFLGKAVGLNAISFHNIAFAAIALALLTLASGRNFIAPLLAAIAALALLPIVIALNPAETHWHGSLILLSAAAFAGAILPPLLRPAWFDRHRSARLAILAMTVPVAGFLSMGHLA